MDQSEVLRFEQQQRVMKLSEAIRIGSRMCEEDRIWTGCALGSACRGGASWGVGHVGNMAKEIFQPEAAK